MTSDRIELAVCETLELLDFNVTAKGYRYLVETIILINNKYCDSLGDAYTHLSLKYKIGKSGIKSTIQRCVKSNIERSSHEALVSVFGTDVRDNKSRNYYLTGEFIYRLMSYMNSKYK